MTRSLGRRTGLARRAARGGGPAVGEDLGPGNPLDILTDVRVLHRSDFVTLDVGVQVWENFGSLGDSTQGLQIRQPGYIASDPDFNGHPSLVFDGADSRMGMVDLTGITDGAEMFVVFKQNFHPPPTEAQAGAWSTGFDALTNDNLVPHSGGLVFSNDLSTSRRVNVPVDDTSIAAWVFSVQSDTNLFKLFFNGTEFFDDPVNAQQMTTFGTIGNSMARILFGKMAEFIICGELQTPQARTDLYAYFNDRYGTALPAGNRVTPLAAGANLSAWYRADILDRAANERVNALLDATQSPRGETDTTLTNDLQQAVNANRPLYVNGGGPGGVGCIRFNGANNERLALTSGGLYSLAGEHLNMVVVARTSNNGLSNQTMVRTEDSGNSPVARLEQDTTDISARIDDPGVSALTATSNDTNFHTYYFSWDGVTHELFIDNVLQASGALAGAQSAVEALSIGGTSAGGDSLTGDLCEVIIFREQPLPSELLTVYSYLDRRYGFSLVP